MSSIAIQQNIRMGHLLAVVLWLFFLAQNGSATASLHNHKHVEFMKNIHRKLAVEQPVLDSPSKSEGRVFYPIGYGADPSGARDSIDAILKAVGEAFQVQKGVEMLPNINDLGGVVIDFQGGNYQISKPISFPPNAGNVVVRGGTLRASNTFPSNHYLIELSTNNIYQHIAIKNTTTDLPIKVDESSSIQYEAITFRDILFDSSFHGGGIIISNAARIRIINCYFLHFTTQGILVNRGHETFISNSFLGQYETVGGDPREHTFTGTAIDLSSNDNAITDVAIFSAAIGIVLKGQANMITGVHCYNKATGFGGVGILVKLAGLSQTRIDNCYLDYNSVVVEDPVQVHVTNGFFLGDGNVVVKSVKGLISGLNIMNNMFSGEAKNMKPIVELDGDFNNIDQVVVDHNNAIGMWMKSTVARLSVGGSNTSKWVVDFSKVLLFPNRISHLHYSLYNKGGVSSNGGLPVHAITNVSNNVVTIESDKVIDGVVSVVVDQYNAVGEEFL